MRLSRFSIVPAAIAAGALLFGREAHAAPLQWYAQPLPVPFLLSSAPIATSISVAPNNSPAVSTSSGAVYYFGSQPCSSPNCFATVGWNVLPSLGSPGGAATVSLSLDGDLFAVDHQGNVFNAVTTQTPDDMLAEVTGWAQLVDQTGTCISQFLAGTSTGYTEVGYTPPASQSVPTVWGLSCSWVGSGGQAIDQWNIGLANFPGGGITLNDSPGWQQLVPGAAAVQLALFTEPGPTNPLVPWAMNAQGSLYMYDGYTFVPMPAPHMLLRQGAKPPSPQWITDHYVLDAGFVWQWNDAAKAWENYASATTPAGTQMIEIAASGPIETVGYGTIGPSQIWGIDDAGTVYSLGIPETNQ